MRSAAVKSPSAPVKAAFAGLVFVLASSAFAPDASALPGIDRAPAAQTAQSLQKARWVCGPYRCWWRPGYGWGRGYGGWGGGYGGWGGSGYGGWRRGYGSGGGGPGYGWGGGWRRDYW
jgi:hypothetical protein